MRPPFDHLFLDLHSLLLYCGLGALLWGAIYLTLGTDARKGNSWDGDGDGDGSGE